MTTRQRRDVNTKGNSVITGLRLERDTAQLLCAKACTDAPDKHGCGNVGELARYYIRTGLGASKAEANSREEHEYLINSGIAGLRLDKFTLTELDSGAAVRGMRKATLARHLIRRGLGIKEKESMRREAGFAALADAYHQGRADTFHGAGE